MPDSITADQLDSEARDELRTLPGDLAEAVARQLVAAGLETDPEKAYEHALAARRLAARVGVIREACGIAAYQAGKWAEALTELRAARRLTGRKSYLPLMADSERALGRLDRALELARGPESEGIDRATEIELRIVESGIRRDQGLYDAAVVALQMPELTARRLRPNSARLFYAYADALHEAGREDEAAQWFRKAATADPDGDTDADERLAEFDDDIIIDDLQEPDDEELNDEELDAELSAAELSAAEDLDPGLLTAAESGAGLPATDDPDAAAQKLPDAKSPDADDSGGGQLGTAADDGA